MESVQLKLKYGILLGKRSINLSLLSNLSNFTKFLINFDSQYKKAMGAVLVYDVTRKSSFNNVKKWLAEIRQHCDLNLVIMLTGNKRDLVDKDPSKREVSTEEASYLAEENNMLFTESSAFSNYKVDELFEKLLRGKYNYFLDYKKFTFNKANYVKMKMKKKLYKLLII